MPRKAKVHVGNRLLEKALKDFEDHVIDRAREIVQETGLKIFNNAVALAPVDDGNLRDSITFESSLDGLSVLIRVGAEYAIYVEYGTGIYAENGDGRKEPWVYWSDKLGRFVYTVGMRAQPFWHSSVDRGARYFRKEMKKLG
ncbi:HK97-gp10 family putative phage morphogenesis protein [Virgibacillus doumboii]|uniref:HK97-gp10 family putative phage morphogenesis protein n=1 Tax=Virgibacillus doumboii TaxID=2697503 RepID=UPI0013DF1C7A|nr:HK97-gp10 family putative phage morphogenesis protein [Virgibacillus doumboii]